MNGFVYFISNGAAAIKIGFSRIPEYRFTQLRAAQHQYQLSIISVVPGSFALEKHVHKMLAAHRLFGEWFSDCDPVRVTMRHLVEGGPDAIGFREERAPELPPAVHEAIRLMEIILSYCPVSARARKKDRWDAVEHALDIPQKLLWKLHYRPTTELFISELFALRTAALRAIDMASSRAAEDRTYVDGLIEEQEKAGQHSKELDDLIDEGRALLEKLQLRNNAIDASKLDNVMAQIGDHT